MTPVCLAVSSVCGRPSEPLSRGHGRILGGDEAPEGSIPWQVLLNADDARAGGMVVGDRWIMTAAHNLFKSPYDALMPNEVKV